MPATETRDILRRASTQILEDGIVELSVSSDRPAMGFWGEREILDHSKNAIDLSRIDQKAAPLLYNHGHHPKLGNITKGNTDGKVLRLTAIWDLEDPEVRPFWDKYVRGFLENTSVRARTLEYVTGQDTDGEYLKITRWQLIEGSIVTLPEDPSVGIGRSLYQPSIGGKDSAIPMEPTPTPSPPTPTPPETPPVDLEVIRAEAAVAEGDRIQGISALGEKYKNVDLARQLIHERASIDVARSKFADFVLEEAHKVATPEAGEIGLSQKEQKSYSILRAIAASISGDWSNAGLEKEASIAAAEKSGMQADITRGKFCIPVADIKLSARALSLPSSRFDVMRASLASDATNIGELITEDFRSADLISLGREQSLSARLNIMMLRNLQGSPIRFPRQTAGLGFNWRNEQDQIAEANLDFTSIDMTPKEFGGIFYYSYLAQHQAEIPQGLEAFARRDFILAYAEFLDDTWLNGSGVTVPAPVPQGVMNMAGMQALGGGLGVNGGQLNPDRIKELITMIRRTKLCRRDELAILSSLNYSDWLSNQKDADGRYIWMRHDQGIADVHPERLWALPYYDSTHVREDLTKGTGTDLSALLVGPFARSIIIGEWYGMMLDTSIHFKFDTAMNAVRMIGTLDVANRLPQCFGIVNDIATT